MSETATDMETFGVSVKLLLLQGKWRLFLQIRLFFDSLHLESYKKKVQKHIQM